MHHNGWRYGLVKPSTPLCCETQILIGFINYTACYVFVACGLKQKIMYCYQCAKGGRITKVLDGDSKCQYNHFAHTLSLDEDIELNDRIVELKERKQNDESNYIREFIANERRQASN